MITKDEVRSTVEALSTERALKLALEALELEDMACRYEKNPTPEHIAKAITAIRSVLNEHGEALAESALERMAENERELGLDYMDLQDKDPELIEQPAQGCEFCSHPLYAGTKCKNCGREQPAIKQDLTPEQPAPVAEPHKQQSAERVEPAAWVETREDGSIYYGVETDTVISDDPSWLERPMPVYTSPPANANAGKPWVGLTDEEMRDLEKQFNAERVRTSDEEYLIIYPSDYWAWQRAIEAKLREKNEHREKNA